MIPEQFLIKYLSEKLNIPVYAEVPERKPEQFITIERVGESTSNYIVQTSIAIQSWDKNSLFGALTLDNRVKEAMREAVEHDEIFSVDMSSNYNFTDTSTKTYRYQCVWEIYHQ